MSTAIASTTHTTIRESYVAAIKRASDEGLLIVRNEDGSATCKDYTLTFEGPCWYDVACNCKAGRNRVVCKHAAAYVFMRKYNATRVQFKGKGVIAQDIAPSTASEIVEHAVLMVQTHREGGTTMSRDEFGIIMRALNNTACTTEQRALLASASNLYALASHRFEPGSTRLVDTRDIAL